MRKETIIPLSVYEKLNKETCTLFNIYSSEINVANFSTEFKFNKKALKLFKKILKKELIKYKDREKGRRK